MILDDPGSAAPKDPMPPARKRMLVLLDRSLVGLLIFIVVLLLGVRAIQIG